MSKESPEALAESLFFDDPDMSVETVLAIVQDNYPNSLTRKSVEDIRDNVQRSIEQAQGGTRGASGLSSAGRPTTVSPKENAVTRDASREEKIAWFDAWLETNYMASIDQARQALISEFGSGFGTAYIQRKVGEMKERHRRRAGSINVTAARPEKDREGVVPTRERLAEIKRLMAEAGIQKCERFEDGTFSFVLVSGRIKL